MGQQTRTNSPNGGLEEEEWGKAAEPGFLAAGHGAENISQ